MDLSEKEYLEINGFDPNIHTIITWPDSQAYLGYNEEDDVHLVIDDEGLELFGSSAYIIPKDLEPYSDEENE